ncbi:MAG: DUF5992 family protein [Aestuariibacter sp.]
MKKYLIALLLISSQVSAGELVSGATIVDMGNTNNNSPDFALFLKGGIGTCSTSGVYKIVFPEIKFQSQSSKSFDHAFSMAMMGLATGKKVRIYNFEDDSCLGANFISVSNE